MTAEAKPLVSLIMTAWQPRGDWLVEAVEGALAQRGCEIELVLVDDGSPTPVSDLLGDVHDPRLRLLRIPHGGLYRARNAGIEAARGGFLRFIDADDVIEADSTARLLELIAGGDDVVAYGTTVRCDANLRPIGEITSSLEGDIAIDCLLSRFTVRHMSMLFPRRVIDLGGLYDVGFATSGDWDFVLRALEHSKVRGAPIVATYYRSHDGQMSSNIERCEEGMERVVQRYFDRHPELRNSRLERRAFAATQLKAARSYRDRGLHREALRRVWSALVLDPRSAVRELGPRIARRAVRVRRAEPASTA
jgi:glycosyltransferase involved in cell wall biosynthesis